MIKEKYMQLLLSHQIRGITTIDDTHKLAARQRASSNNFPQIKNIKQEKSYDKK